VAGRVCRHCRLEELFLGWEVRCGSLLWDLCVGVWLFVQGGPCSGVWLHGWVCVAEAGRKLFACRRAAPTLYRVGQGCVLCPVSCTAAFCIATSSSSSSLTLHASPLPGSLPAA
jgi:hypothetical protein